MHKIIHFIKYNNITVLVLFVVLLLGTGAFAQTEVGQKVIGQRQTKVEGVDNTLLLEADLDNFDMDFKIEKIEKDDKYYYITYTYLDLVRKNNAWQYEIKEKVKKVSLKRLKKDLGAFLAEELKEEYDARIKDLKLAQEKARKEGPKKRVEVTEYNGLIGKTLSLADKIFPGYEAAKKREIPSPVERTYRTDNRIETYGTWNDGSNVDNLTRVWEKYVKENPEKIAELNRVDGTEINGTDGTNGTNETDETEKGVNETGTSSKEILNEEEENNSEDLTEDVVIEDNIASDTEEVIIEEEIEEIGKTGTGTEEAEAEINETDGTDETGTGTEETIN